jgi:Icc-related predicted phosphoesterase
MKFCCISDIHENFNVKIPKCDYLLIGGDILANPTIRSQLFWMQKFEVFISKIEDRGIKWLMTPGNHDTIFESNFYHLVSDRIKRNTLIDEYRLIENHSLSVYGSPWQRTFFNWAFNKDEEDLVNTWSRIPENTEILLLHSPPFGILDANLGSISLTERIKELKKLKLVVFGHIHYGYGKTVDKNGVIFVNAALCNNRNELVNKPIIVEI